uniref:Uncharacterized protein n=1 Tax=Arundo donax TaxID=35708 RepID=A0A0A9FEX5_ARUDO
MFCSRGLLNMRWRLDYGFGDVGLGNIGWDFFNPLFRLVEWENIVGFGKCFEQPISHWLKPVAGVMIGMSGKRLFIYRTALYFCHFLKQTRMATNELC